MKKIRIIHYSSQIGEGVYFTANLKDHANDFIPLSASVESETIIDVILPPSFPLEKELESI